MPSSTRRIQSHVTHIPSPTPPPLFRKKEQSKLVMCTCFAFLFVCSKLVKRGQKRLADLQTYNPSSKVLIGWFLTFSNFFHLELHNKSCVTSTDLRLNIYKNQIENWTMTICQFLNSQIHSLLKYCGIIVINN